MPRSSSSGNPSDEQGPRRSPSARHSFPSQTISYEYQGASPTTTEIEPTSMSISPQGLTPQERPDDMEPGSGGDGAERSSPSVSSSQGDMADTEMEPGPSQTSDAPQPSTTQPKKKRTRTLTTPHQSAVLHALLAQSRFPSTAMREEVGRAIGLSARKVQIWFQNQRQKARRPRGQAMTPLTRPPQFGPFSNAPPVSSSNAPLPAPYHSSASSEHRMPFPIPPGVLGVNEASASGSQFYHDQDSPMIQVYSRSASSTHLLGPGIPGPESRDRAQFSLPRLAGGSAALPETPALIASFPDVDRTPLYLRPRPATAEESTEMIRMSQAPARRPRPLSDDLTGHQRATPLRLPPIVAGTVPTLGGVSANASDSPSTSPVEHWRQWRNLAQPVSSFVRQPPLVIPPPFTLEPQPQWDDPAFSPFSRPRTSAGSGTGAGYNSLPSLGPPASEHALPGTDTGLPISETRSLRGMQNRQNTGFSLAPGPHFSPTDSTASHNARSDCTTPRRHPHSSDNDPR